jgi:hypothetical protein
MPEERQELREWLAADEFAETDELIAAVDDGIRSAQSGSSLFNRGSQGTNP